MGEFRDRLTNRLMDFFISTYQKRAARRSERVRELQAKQAGGAGKITRIVVYEGDMHRRNEFHIPTKEFMVRGKDGGWEHLPLTTSPDTIVRLNAVVFKGIATGVFALPMANGTVKEWGPKSPNGIFTASDALAWDLIATENPGAKTGLVRNILLFDKEIESMLNDLRLYDDHGNFTG